MADMSAIAAALAAFNTAKNIAQAMIGLRDAAAFQSKMIEFQSAILDAQNSAFAANDERAAMIERVRELETKVAKLEAWEAQKQRYKLDRLEPGVFVYTLKPEMAAGEPPHHICQTCYERGKRSVLHADEHVNGIHHLSCNDCGAKLQVGNWNPPKLDYDNGIDDGPNAWMGR
ncbi:MAG TPA: hypothetical protein VFA50_13255 [Stellaceae bacterium]|nr:hypothetical protein [Stellaceae bacterium]